MKNTFSSIAHSSAVIMFSRGAMKVLSLVSVYLIITALSLREYGTLSLALSVSGPVLALSNFGLDDLIMAQGARARGEKTLGQFLPMYRGFVFVKIVLIIVLMILAAGFRLVLSSEQRALLDQFFLPLLVWIAATGARTIFDSTLQMYERFGWFAKTNIFENALRLAMVATFFALHRLTLANVLWSYVGSKTAASLAAAPILGLVGIEGGLVPSLRAFFHFVIGRGKWEVLRTFFVNIFSGVDQWVVGYFLGLEAVAIFSFASMMNSLLVQALPFRQILFPFMARMSAGASERTSFVARRMSKYSVWLATLTIIVAAVCAPTAVRLFAPKYMAAVPIFLFLSVSQIMNGYSVSHGPLLYALNEQRFLLALGFVTTISSFTFLPLLTKFFALMGAVAERHASTAVIIWLRERRLRKRHGIKTYAFRDLFVFDAFDVTIVKRIWHAGVSRLRTRRILPG